MKRSVWLAFCLVLAAGIGCGITDYGIITDNDQTNNDSSQGGAGGGGSIVNTNGKAHIQESSQIATIWPDGSSDESINFVDQRANGTAELTTYNNYSSGSHPTFHDDLYCNPDWNGCSVYTAPDNNDENLFDLRFNFNCSGGRSFCILLATSRYYGECGRIEKMPLEERIGLVSMANLAERFGREGLLWQVDRTNTTITLTNENGSWVAPLYGGADVWVSPGRNLGVIDLNNTLLGSSIGWYASWLDRDATDRTTVRVCYNGICADSLIAGNDGVVSTGARVRALRNSRF